MLNRETVRMAKSLPMRRFEQVVNEVFDENMEKARNHGMRMAWAASFLAIWEQSRCTKDEIQHLAIRTLELMNTALSAEELIQRLKDETGFDVNQAPKEYTWAETQESEV